MNLNFIVKEGTYIYTHHINVGWLIVKRRHLWDSNMKDHLVVQDEILVIPNVENCQFPIKSPDPYN